MAVARRSKASREPTKARRRKTATTLDHRPGPKTAYHGNAAVADNETTIARLSGELKEALHQQTATAEVLKIISGSAFDLQTVLNMLVELALHLCEADAANIWLPSGNVLKLAANAAIPANSSDLRRTIRLHLGAEPFRGGCSWKVRPFTSRMCWRTGNSPAPVINRAAGIGAISACRCCERAAPIGVFALTRTEVSPFSGKQIEFVETFANQAVIAIETCAADRDRKAPRPRTGEIAAAAAARAQQQDHEPGGHGGVHFT